VCLTAASRCTARPATPRPGQPNVTAGFALRPRDGKVGAAAPETALKPGPTAPSRGASALRSTAFRPAATR
jgi:hypothetical protein